MNVGGKMDRAFSADRVPGGPAGSPPDHSDFSNRFPFHGDFDLRKAKDPAVIPEPFLPRKGATGGRAYGATDFDFFAGSDHGKIQAPA